MKHEHVLRDGSYLQFKTSGCLYALIPPSYVKVLRMRSLKRLLLACEASIILRDWDLVFRVVWRAYNLVLPLLEVRAMGRLIFQVRRDKVMIPS